MNEGAPQPEVPEIYFDRAWQESNFLIPENEKIRAELRKKLEGYSLHDRMNLPKHQKSRTVLLAHIASIDAYDAEMLKAKK